MRIYFWLGRALLCAAMTFVFLKASRAEPVHATTKATAAHVERAAGKKSRPSTVRMPVGKLNLRSSSVMVMDAVDSSILYSREASRPMPVASITKLMTALVVLEGGQPLDEVIEISALDRDTEHGSGSRLRVGTQLSREDMLHLALMSSENRAAHALGRTYPGGMDKFVRAMNVKARALGMRSAHFVDPTGLSSGNVSNAADLAKLVLAASDNSVIQSFSTNENYSVSVGKQLLEFRNTNSLVSKPDWDISVQKTGYTAAAGRCLVMQTLIHDRPIVIVLLNSFGKYTRVADVRRIREWMEKAAAPAQLAGR